MAGEADDEYLGEIKIAPARGPGPDNAPWPITHADDGEPEVICHDGALVVETFKPEVLNMFARNAVSAISACRKALDRQPDRSNIGGADVLIMMLSRVIRLVT